MTNVDSFAPLRVASLCAGIGGIDLGIRLACPEAVTRLYVEIEATAAAILVARIEDGALDDAPIWSNLKTFQGRDWRGHIDMVVAGYPCQPFSAAGKQQGTKDPRHLWPHVARIIREVEPEWVFLENVSNHLRIGFRQVAAKLRRMGYRVEAGLFTAAEVGAPHLRKRLFVLAHAARYERTGSLGKERSGRGVCQTGDALAHREVNGRDQQSGIGSVTQGARIVEQRESRGSGALLAHGAQRGRRELRQPSGSDRLTDGRGEELADTGVGLVPLAQRRSQGRTGIGPAGADVGNAQRAERRTDDQRIGEQGDQDPGAVRGAGALVADTGQPHRQRRPAHADSQPGQRPSDRTRGAGDQLADPRSALQRTRPRLRGNGLALQAARSGDSRTGLADTGGAGLPHTESDTVAAARRRQQGRAATELRGAPSWPVFPPGPDDLAGWQQLLARDASVEPAIKSKIRGNADGILSGLDGSSRVDRLRSLGNAVVPLVAAFAFSTLRDRYGSVNVTHL